MRTVLIAAAMMAAVSVSKAQGGDDKDKSTGGSGVPAGYMGRTDRETAKIADAKYVSKGGKWEITTGPAHIVYSPKNTATGVYQVTSTIDQLEAPAHPEAYGIFFGGKNLDQPTQTYTYFEVRGTGEYLIKVREGDKTRTVTNWTASDAVPKADASGKGSYKLSVHFAPDVAHFSVNDKLVATVPKKDLTTEGIYGIRVNHNLHVAVSPVEKK